MYFPEEFNLKIVSDTYENYDVGYYEDIGQVAIYCETCEECVAAFPYNSVKDLSTIEFYEKIINRHRKRNNRIQ